MIRYLLRGCFVLLAFIPYACMDDEALWNFDRPEYPAFSRGVFVVNEGNFMYGNASLSYYDIEERHVFNDVFYKANALPLGDVASSMVIRDSLGYVVLNNSGRIYIFNINTFEYVGKITGLTSPRYIHFVSDTKAYVTDLYARAISIVNPNTLEVTGTISVLNTGSPFAQHSTEQMVQHGHHVFVNCWSFDNQILVIDTERDQWIASIEVLKQPNSMVIDRYGKLWVLTDGGFAGSPFGHEAPGLIRIDAATMEVEHTYRFALHDSPRSLIINASKDTLYYINHDVHRHPVHASGSPGVFVNSPYASSHSAGFHAVGVDPNSSEIFIADAIDYVQPGLVYRFLPDATPVDTFRVGIIPREFCFLP